MNRKLPALLGLLLIGLAVVGCGGAAQAAQSPTLQPTETARPLVTPTIVPALPPMDLPVVDWSDVSAHKLAMKAGYESDVDQFVNGNRYLIVASVSFEPDAVIRGAQRVRYTNQSKDTLDLIVFRLYPNGPALGGRMNVSHVEIGGKKIEPSLSALGSVMGVPLSSPLAPGDSVEIKLDFSLVMVKGLNTSYGRFGYVNEVVSSTAWYPTLSVYEPGHGWWDAMPSPQGDPGYTETGLYDVRLTLPADMTVAMSGTIIETTPNDDKTVTHRGVTGPMRDHAFQASTRYMITPIEVDGTTVQILHYKDKAATETDGTENVKKFAETSVKTFNQVFGHYPYKTLIVAQNPTPSGVEFPGLIQIAERAWIKGQPFLEVVIAHEIGHQWFYSLVGNNQVEHPWIDESLTSFTEIVYMRVAYAGTDRPKEYVENYKRQFSSYTGSGQADLPLNLPVKNYGNFSYGAIIYRKGPLFYVELERLLGQETVYNALNTYFSAMKYKVAVSSDVLAAFQSVSGKSLDTVFSKWVGPYTADRLPSTRLAEAGN
jgi:hypothetical protein